MARDNVMTEQEAIEKIKDLSDRGYPTLRKAKEMAISALEEVQQYREIGSVGEIKQAIGVLSLSENDIIKTFHELNEYRKIGTVEQVENQKENLNVAYQIISDYEQYGTIEDFKKAQRYMRLVNAHGTIVRVIDLCAEYKSIGTVEECRESREKQMPKKPVCKPKPYNESVGFNEEWFCPSCGAYIGYFYEGMDEPEQMEYCNECGQHIARDWSDENEDE